MSVIRYYKMLICLQALSFLSELDRRPGDGVSSRALQVHVSAGEARQQQHLSRTLQHAHWRVSTSAATALPRMQNMIGACACSRCPNQPSKAIVNADKLKDVFKCLGAGEVSFDEFGTFTMNGQMIDQKYRPGKRDAGLDAIILILSTEAVTLVPPRLYENGMLLLQDFYKHTKWTREKLERTRVAPSEGAIPLTFYDALAWQIMKGPAKAADIAISMVRCVCRDTKAADRMACLLWKRDKKSKLYLGATNLIARLGSKQNSKALQVLSPVEHYHLCMS